MICDDRLSERIPEMENNRSLGTLVEGQQRISWATSGMSVTYSPYFSYNISCYFIYFIHGNKITT